MCRPSRAERSPLFCVVPPYLLRHLARQPAPALRRLAEWALQSLLLSERLRGERLGVGAIAPRVALPAGQKRRTIFDAGNRERLPGTRVRGESDPPAADPAVNEAFDGAGATYDLYFDAYQRNSIDDRGMRLDSTVHYGMKFDNAFWNGRQMVYGDGDNVIFGRFTRCIDVIGHELTHGVTQVEAALVYEGQSGALNESISDVFGSLVKQRVLDQTAEQADWLIGAGIFMKGVHGEALRSMKAPGTAYDDPRIGKDPQPADMKHYVDTSEDDGGVHINSGIPNRAFHEFAVTLGGRAWERAGRVWYVTLRDRLRSDATFLDAARATEAVAGELFGATAARAAHDAWKTVGVAPRTRPRTRAGSGSRRTRIRKRGRAA
jgi:Zn-dependent metalloprotease